MKTEQLGLLFIEQGDVVCFSTDSLQELADRLDIDLDTLLTQYEGVPCKITGTGNYRVNKAAVVDVNGHTYPVVIIGSEPEKFLRFLGEHEPTWETFYKSHSRSSEVGRGAEFKPDILNQIILDYQRQLLG